MNSRQRVEAAINHQQPDHVPLDLGGSPTSGMHVSSVYKLRQALGLDGPVKVIEPYQMLGQIDADLLDALGVDVVALEGPGTFFGFKKENWKPWTTFDGTPVLVPECFNTEPEPSGDILMYPEGDRSAPPSGHMPKDGFYFDTIIRQPPINDANLNVEDNLEEFGPASDELIDYFVAEADRVQSYGERAVLATLGGTGFGDIALVPAPGMKYPKGIRDVAEWYMSTVTRFDYIYELFERQCEIGLANLEKFHAALGDRITALFVTGTDFGAQDGSFISNRSYCDLYQPFHAKVNAWVHENTNWKTFIHSCGSIVNLLPEMIDAGFDIVNPVQTSAAGMDARGLKERFGERITFWGGGIDTQKTLPFGTPEQVREEVLDRIEIFGDGGGFVFNTVHNVQAGVPVENLVALYDAVRESRDR